MEGQNQTGIKTKMKITILILIRPKQIAMIPILKNHGKLVLDATCARAHISYPTDIKRLNEAREKLEYIIDVLHEPLKGTLESSNF
ncbi:hypothetical protein CQJ30_17395 [Caldibacillus thermoamylovorans]|jgi:hypothetical protein|nr:hypothetical protein CQJ30_17395 [Caldibacillus thermoamylovorans]